MLLARTATTMVQLILVLSALERFHSPGLAGAVTFLALALTSVCYASAAVITVPLRDPLGRVPHGGLLSDAWAGLLYTWRNRTLRGLGISVSTANIANGLFYIGLPVFVLSRLGGGAAEVGQLFALMGVTAAVSVLFVGRVGTEGRERLSPGD